MRIRQGFVSNSSSSSFCLWGVRVQPEDYKGEVYGLDGLSEYIWKLKGTDKAKFGPLTADAGIENYSPDNYFVGISPSAMQGDETLNQFKQRVLATLVEAKIPAKIEDIKFYMDAGQRG